MFAARGGWGKGKGHATRFDGGTAKQPAPIGRQAMLTRRGSLNLPVAISGTTARRCTVACVGCVGRLLGGRDRTTWRSPSSSSRPSSQALKRGTDLSCGRLEITQKTGRGNSETRGRPTGRGAGAEAWIRALCVPRSARTPSLTRGGRAASCPGAHRTAHAVPRPGCIRDS